MYHGVCVEWIDDLKVPKVGSVLKCLKLRNSVNYIKSSERSDTITLGTLDHFRHFELIAST